MNSEMGELRDAQIKLTNAQLSMNDKIDAMVWVWGVIGVVIIGLVIKKMWGNK
jgi:hypothetical protein